YPLRFASLESSSACLGSNAPWSVSTVQPSRASSAALSMAPWNPLVQALGLNGRRLDEYDLLLFCFLYDIQVTLNYQVGAIMPTSFLGISFTEETPNTWV